MKTSKSHWALSIKVWFQDSRHAIRATVALWAVPMLVIAVLVTLLPNHHTVTHLYHEASANWRQRQEMYRGPGGMNYLPQFVLVFSMFHALPVPLGDIAWRFLEAGLLATGVWRLVRNHFGTTAPQQFFWISLLSLPLSLSTLRNGQATALLAALTLHAVASMSEAQWWRSVCWMLLALAMKPLGIILILLAPVVYAPLRWRVPLAVLFFVALPFLFADSAYVVEQYRHAFANLQACAGPTPRPFADINGVLRPLGLAIPFSFLPLACALAGLGPLALCWFGSRHVRSSLLAAWLYTITAAYLMLFTPMNEANSYVMLAPALGFWTMEFYYRNGRNGRSSRSAGAIVLIIVSMSFLPNLLRPMVGNIFADFWYPFMTIIFVTILLAGHFSDRKAVRVTDPV